MSDSVTPRPQPDGAARRPASEVVSRGGAPGQTGRGAAGGGALGQTGRSAAGGGALGHTGRSAAGGGALGQTGRSAAGGIAPGRTGASNPPDTWQWLPRPGDTDEFTVLDEADLDARSMDPSEDDELAPRRPEGTPRASRSRRALLAAAGLKVAWLAVAAAIALGSAGIVGATAHSPATDGRPELTWSADEALRPRLDAAVNDIGGVSTEVNALGDLARSARSALTQQNRVDFEAAVNDGTKVIASIGADTRAIDERLGCDQGSDRLRLENRPDLVARFERICAALGATGSLSDDWTSFVDASQTAMQVTNLIAQHDTTAGAAVQLGSKAQYAAAIAKLKQATPAVATVRKLHDQLAVRTDVSTLGQWVDRTQAMDDALGTFWQAMLESKGRVTPKVSQALKAVNQARDLLPPDSRYMAVVLAEMAQGGVDEAAIAIETAKGRLSAAVEDLSGGQ